MGIMVHRPHRPMTEAEGSQGEDAGAAAGIDQTSPWAIEQQGQTHSRGRMLAGAEGEARIDDDIDQIALGYVPWRTEPEATRDHDGAMKLPQSAFPVRGLGARAEREVQPRGSDAALELNLRLRVVAPEVERDPPVTEIALPASPGEVTDEDQKVGRRRCGGDQSEAAQ